MADVSRGQEEPAHDILAAEAFAVPAPDPRLSRGLVLPDDPAADAEPHDILAAEAFAMPAPEPQTRVRRGAGRGARVGVWMVLAAAAALLRRAVRHRL